MGGSDLCQLCSRAAARFSTVPGRGSTEPANIPLRGRGGPSALCAAAQIHGESERGKGWCVSWTKLTEMFSWKLSHLV